MPTAEEQLYCVEFQEPGDPRTTQTPLFLSAGQRYAVLAYYKHAGGWGYVQTGWRKVGDETPAALITPIPGTFLSSPASGGRLTVQQEPADTTATEHASATFTVAASGTPVRSVLVQWQRNGTNIPGATGPQLTIAVVTSADHGAKFRAQVSAPGVVQLTREATLTVEPDLTPPALVSAAGSDTIRSVTVVYSEPVTGASAGNKLN